MLKLIFKVALIHFLLVRAPVYAKEVNVAVASNFSGPAEKIAAEFTAQTGHKILISSGASGKFFAQIQNGAPFEVFLSADQEHPQKLIREKLANETSQFTYAIGKLVLWAPQNRFKKIFIELNSSSDVSLQFLKNSIGENALQHIAIANPKLAPYGQAAEALLRKKNLWSDIQSKLVIGENIAQTYQFVSTGNAEVGFVAFSQVKKDYENKKGSFWVVPSDLYVSIKQDAVLLKKGQSNEVALKFLEFLKSEKAKKIIIEYGYDIVKQ